MLTVMICSKSQLDKEIKSIIRILGYIDFLDQLKSVIRIKIFNFHKIK